jgi:hypothetical protein
MQSNRALDLVNAHWLFRGSLPEPGPPGNDPGGAAEAADLHRRAAAVADGLGLAEVAGRERASAERRSPR